MTQPTYFFRLRLPRSIRVEGRATSREDFFSWVWAKFSTRGLLGVHEGTVLSEQASGQGLNTESWTVDSGEAPRDRDWIATQDIESADLYFESEKSAASAAKEIQRLSGIEAGPVQLQKPQDWDAEWKASFTGASVPPFWEVRPPWVESALPPGKKLLRLNPGAGFGTGTHETTQLCLQALGDLSLKRPFWGLRALDFGSGSGILSIGAALLDAEVDAVEIDPLANENARENAKLNSMEFKIHFTEALPDPAGPYPLVIANILRPVLIEFSSKLCRALAPEGSLILSGLIESDVKPVIERYSSLLPGRAAPKVHSLNEWRAIVWERD